MLLWHNIYLICILSTAYATSLTLRKTVREFSDASDILHSHVPARRSPLRASQEDARHGPHKRAVVSTSYSYGLTAYMVEMYFGTPLEPVDCYIANFDSDTWITTPSSSQSSCAESLYEGTCGHFEYDYRKSSSVDTSLGYTNFSRSGNMKLEGFYASDIVALTIGSQNLTFPNMTFGLATTADEAICVLGLGPVNGVTTGVTMENGIVYPTYNNVPVLAKSHGYSASASYSLFFGSSSGNLIFGSVDHSKYIGNLSVVPIVDYSLGKGRFLGSSSQPLNIQIMLHEVSATDANGTKILLANTSIPVQVGVGLPLCYIPESILTMIAVMFGMTFSEELGLYMADCNSTGQIEVNLSGISYVVPIKNFFATVLRDNQNHCPVLIIPSAQAYYVLGDPFTSSVFLAVDFENLELGIAPVSYSNQTDIEPIVSGLPRGVYAPNYNATMVFNQVKTFSFPSNYTAPIPIVLNHSPKTFISMPVVVVGLFVGLAIVF